MATVDLVLLSTGKSRKYLYWNIVTSTTYVASFVAGLSWGIAGVAGAYAIANYALALPAAVYCLARSPVRVRDFSREWLVPLGLSGLVAGIVLAMHAAVGYSLLWEGVGVVLFVVVYCGLSLARPSVRDLIRPLRAAPRSTE
jgi:PST family polysaccharide transporter